MELVLTRLKVHILKYNFFNQSEFQEAFGEVPFESCIVCQTYNENHFRTSDKVESCDHYICMSCYNKYNISEANCPIHRISLNKIKNIYNFCTDLNYDKEIEARKKYSEESLEKKVIEDQRFVMNLNMLKEKLIDYNRSDNYDKMNDFKQIKSFIQNFMKDNINDNKETFEEEYEDLNCFDERYMYEYSDDFFTKTNFVMQFWTKSYQRKVSDAVNENLESITSLNIEIRIALIIQVIEEMIIMAGQTTNTSIFMCLIDN